MSSWKGPGLFGRSTTIGDAVYAPVVFRFRSRHVQVCPVSAAYRAHVWTWPDLAERVAAAQLEPEQAEELEVEFRTGYGNAGHVRRNHVPGAR